MISQDVFHSFSIPDFRVKREVIPGRYTTVWFNATTPGTYHLFCTQYCGSNHSQMIGEVTVADARGLRESGRRSPPAACPSRKTASVSLLAWAATPATPATRPRAGPALQMSMAVNWQLSDGSQVTGGRRLPARVDPEPVAARVTAGYAPIMPTYQGQISEEGLIDLVEYLKTLNTNYRVQQTLTTTLIRKPARPVLARSPGANAGDGETMSTQCARDGEPMSTIVTLARSIHGEVAEGELTSTSSMGILSWLLTGDHKRIAMLYLFSITGFFFLGRRLRRHHTAGAADARGRPGLRRHL
jgi:hypothetical protein